LKKKSKTLLIGGAGNLGSEIEKSGLFTNLHVPSKKKLNIENSRTIYKELRKKNFDLIINCAALARMEYCEKNPVKAIKVNIFGTMNLIEEVINYENQFNKKIKLIHISSDGVYPSTKGNYSEKSKTEPYNVYGWTKLYSEQIVKKLKKYIIIRTRFFSKNNIKFETAATDIYSSMMEVQNLVKAIKKISTKKFTGIINIGETRKSNFQIYKKYKKKIKPCKRKDVIKNLGFILAKDASMNLKLFKKINDRN
jgi:dTDP-4-dehydrorhamnose reductase